MCRLRRTIKKAARVCIKCNNYQDWRAELGVSNTVLTLLIALISVSLTALPAFKAAFGPHNSIIGFTYQASNPWNITFLASNTGDKSGSMHSPILCVDDSGTAGSGMRLDIRKPERTGERAEALNAILVAPSQSQLVDFTVLTPMPTDFLTNFFSTAPKNKCQITIRTVEGRENSTAIRKDVLCAEVSKFIQGRIATLNESTHPTSSFEVSSGKLDPLQACRPDTAL